MHTKIIHLTTAKLGRQLPLVLYLPTHATFVIVILVRTHAEGISLYSLCTRCANELVLANRGNRRFPLLQICPSAKMHTVEPTITTLEFTWRLH